MSNDDLFSQLFGSKNNDFESIFSSSYETTISSKVTVNRKVETDSIIYTVDVPGHGPGDVHAEVIEGVAFVKYGGKTLKFTLDSNATSDGVKGEVKNGQLILTFGRNSNPTSYQILVS